MREQSAHRLLRPSRLPGKGTALWRVLGIAVLAGMAAPAEAQPASVLSESRLIRVLRAQVNDDPAAVITALAIHPSGDLLAAAGDDHVVRLWNFADGELLSEQVGHADWVRSAAFSQRGDELFTAAADGKVLAWYPTRRTPPKTVFARDAALLSLALTQDGQLAVLAGFDGPIQMVGTKGQRSLRQVSCACEHIRTVAISADGSTLACGGCDGQVFIWSLQTGELRHTLPAHSRRINCMTFDPEEPWLITAGDDRRICLWDCERGTQVACVSSGRAKVLSLAALGQGGLA
ncbi:MAG: WD40 repeat domain-containing protein, partial [Planctomycetota bacterium]